MLLMCLVLAGFVFSSCQIVDFIKVKLGLGSFCPDVEYDGEAMVELKIVDDEGGKDLFSRVAENLKSDGPVKFGTDHFPSSAELVCLEAPDDPSGESGRRILENILDSVDIPEDRSIGYRKVPPYEGMGEMKWQALYLKEPAVLTSECFDEVEAEEDPMTGAPHVFVILNEAGKKIFAKVTGENVTRRLAVIVNGEIYSAPIIQEKISGGRLRISLPSDADPSQLKIEACKLAAALNRKDR